MKKVAVLIGGASGSLYAKLLLDKLASPEIQAQTKAVGVVMSKNARFNWSYELGDTSYESYPFNFYEKHDFNAPFASGSAKYDTVIVCPCSMGFLGRAAAGVSDDLASRAADVALKERRKLILVLRETPYSLLHIDNMRRLAEAGAIICPASPSFYSRPQTVEALAMTVVDRVLDLAGFEFNTYRWGE